MTIMTEEERRTHILDRLAQKYKPGQLYCVTSRLTMFKTIGSSAGRPLGHDGTTPSSTRAARAWELAGIIEENEFFMLLALCMDEFAGKPALKVLHKEVTGYLRLWEFEIEMYISTNLPTNVCV